MTLAVLDGGTYYHHETIHGARYRGLFDRAIYIPDLTPADLDDVAVLIVPDRSPPDLLRLHAGLFGNFLQRGRTLVVLGENAAESWAPGVVWSSRPTNFWWWLEPGAETLIAVPPDAEGHDGGALLYDDCVSTPGRLLVSTLDPFYHHGSRFMPATTRFLDGFLPWACDLAHRKAA